MAQVHTYKHEAKDVVLVGIDHSVGRHGSNRMDDVQLIQILINRYIVFREYAVQQSKSPANEKARVLDPTGQLIDKLDVDGVCGPLTLAAILAAQTSLNRWRRVTVDGRIDPIAEGGEAQYKDGSWDYDFVDVNGRQVPYRWKASLFNTMYLLSMVSSWEDFITGNPPFDIFKLPEPLKSSLLRSSINRGASSLRQLVQPE